MVATMNGNAADTERKDHICVAVRFRPLSDKERGRGDHEVWNCQGNAVGIVTTEEVEMDVKFVYDHVFPAGFSNQGVYDTVASSIVKSSLDGINGTVFAYGVTSSGKTHTMMGDDITPGIVPHAIAEVFHLVDKLSKRKEFTIRLSMLEIYNEIVNDLLEPSNANLRLREDPRKGVIVDGIKEERLTSADHALHVVATGNEHRKISATAFNEGSSRSHTIIRLSIEANDRPEFAKDPNAHIGRTFSYLTMVDLAGSESAKAEVNRSQRMEGSFINKSLLTLGTVINKLSEGGAVHIPFRDSKLTRILSNSLTGNGARISVVCTITPASTQAEETHNTLKFASRAKKIAIEAKRNEILEQSSLIARYQQELELLRRQLEHYKSNGAAVPGASGASEVEVLTLREKYEEEHMAVVELEKERENLSHRVDRLTQCVLDSNTALSFLDKRLRDEAYAQNVDEASFQDECTTLRRQVVALVEELREREKAFYNLSTHGGLDEYEEDVTMQVMLAEREYMQLHVQEIDSRNHGLAAALEVMRRRVAAAEKIDPDSIDLEAIISGEEIIIPTNDGTSTTTATPEQAKDIEISSLPLRRGYDHALAERVMTLQKRVVSAIDSLQQKEEKFNRHRELHQTVAGLHARVNAQLEDITAENKNLKKELSRVEVMNEQLQGYSVEHLTQSELLQLIIKLTAAVDRVRVAVGCKNIALRTKRADTKMILLSSPEQREAKWKMSLEDYGKTIAGLKNYVSRPVRSKEEADAENLNGDS